MECRRQGRKLTLGHIAGVVRAGFRRRFLGGVGSLAARFAEEDARGFQPTVQQRREPEPQEKKHTNASQAKHAVTFERAACFVNRVASRGVGRSENARPPCFHTFPGSVELQLGFGTW